MTSPNLVTYEVTDQIATIAMNQPEKGNAYTEAMGRDLVAALNRADGDPEVRVVILTGNGANFCFGADLSGGRFGDSDGPLPEDWKEPAGIVTARIYELDKPVIAAIRGAAIGAGSTIVLACDYRLAAPDTRFGYIFSRRGIYPEGISAWFLPRLVGLATAMDWMVSGRLIAVEEADKAGLVHGIHDDVETAARDLATDLVRKTAPVATAVIRRMLFHALTASSPYDIQQIDSRLIASITTSPDALEGVASFFERRDPHFPGRVPENLPAWLPWLTEP